MTRKEYRDLRWKIKMEYERNLNSLAVVWKLIHGTNPPGDGDTNSKSGDAPVGGGEEG